MRKEYVLVDLHVRPNGDMIPTCYPILTETENYILAEEIGMIRKDYITYDKDSMITINGHVYTIVEKKKPTKSEEVALLISQREKLQESIRAIDKRLLELYKKEDQNK